MTAFEEIVVLHADQTFGTIVDERCTVELVRVANAVCLVAGIQFNSGGKVLVFQYAPLGNRKLLQMSVHPSLYVRPCSVGRQPRLLNGIAQTIRPTEALDVQVLRG